MLSVVWVTPLESVPVTHTMVGDVVDVVEDEEEDADEEEEVLAATMRPKKAVKKKTN